MSTTEFGPAQAPEEETAKFTVEVFPMRERSSVRITRVDEGETEKP